MKNASFHRGIAVIAILAATLTAAACGDSTTEASASISGTYSLTSVNGGSLPYRQAFQEFEDGTTYTDSIITNSMSLLLNATNTFRLIINQREKFFTGSNIILNETSTDTATGTWAQSGSSITATFLAGNDGPDVITGTHSGNTLSFVVKDTVQTSATTTTVVTNTFLFTKQ